MSGKHSYRANILQSKHAMICTAALEVIHVEVICLCSSTDLHKCSRETWCMAERAQ